MSSSARGECESPVSASSKMLFSSPKRKRSEGMNNSIHRALEGSPKSRYYDKQKQENNRNSNTMMSFSAPSSSFMYQNHNDYDYHGRGEGLMGTEVYEVASSSSSSSRNKMPPSPAPKTRSRSLNNKDYQLQVELDNVNTKCTYNNNKEEKESKYVPYLSNFELVDRELGLDRPKSTMRTLFTDDPHDELLKESGIIDDFIVSTSVAKTTTDDDDDDDIIVNKHDRWSATVYRSNLGGVSSSRMSRGVVENESFLESPIEFGKKLCFSPTKVKPLTKGMRQQQQKYELHNSEFIVPSVALRSSADGIARLTAHTVHYSPDRGGSKRNDDSWCPACKTHSCIGSGTSVSCVHCQRSYTCHDGNDAFSTGRHEALDVSPVPRVGSPQHFDEMEYFPKGNRVDIHDTSDDANISDNSHTLPVSDVSRGSNGIESSCDVTFTDLDLNNSTSSPMKSSSSSSTAGKSAMVLPDQSAFDTSRNSSDRYNNNSITSPICPPTPHRTPTWAHDTGEATGLHPLGLHRQNSLATSKLLFSAQSQQSVGDSESEEKEREVSFARDFEEQGIIGSGTFSDVYLVCERGGMRKRYAVKKSKRQFKSKKDRDLLMNEVKIMGLLGNSCENIIQLVRAWQESGFFYVQIDLAERGTLKDLLCDLSQREDRVPDATIWKIAHDVTNGLHHIHSCGLVHLDIKPANILIGDNGILKIGDFGMATAQGVGDDGEEGDQRYMAPELLKSMDHKPSADIFSMALSLYETCLVPAWDILPVNGEKWHDLREGRALASPGRPEAINNLMMQCMAPEPDDRLSTYELLMKDEIVEVSAVVDTLLLSAKVRQPTGKKLSRSRSFRPIEGESSMSAYSIDTTSSSMVRSTSKDLLRNKTPTNMEGHFAFDYLENNFSTCSKINESRMGPEDDDDGDDHVGFSKIPAVRSPELDPTSGELGFRNMMEGTAASSNQRRTGSVVGTNYAKKAIDFSSPQGVNNDWSTEMSSENIQINYNSKNEVVLETVEAEGEIEQ